MMTRFSKAVLFSAFALFLSSSVKAATVAWTNWTSSTANTAAGSLLTGGSTVAVSYSGEISFTQLNNSGTNYYTPAGTYVNGPTTSDLIAITGSNTVHTITFSSAVTNPEIAIVSLGGSTGSTSYTFNAPFTILSQGSGFFGGCATCLTVGGNTLTGAEGAGIIQFTGSFTSLSFTGGATAEYWNGFTVGDPIVATVVPEPASLGAAFAGLLALGAFARKRRQA
jgi:hypothetical protein